MPDSLVRFANPSLRTVDARSTVGEVRALSRELKIHHFPVMKGAELVGVVCECDLQRLPDSEPIASWYRAPLTLSLEHSELDAAELMRECGVGSLVLLEGEEPLGIVTRQSTDVLAIEDPLVASAVKYIRQHACDGISVVDVLQHVPVSRSILERRFRKFIGRSPQSEIRNVQLKRVKQLLRETDLPLERIAGLSGYDHPEYMSVVFKRELGQTPGQYRTQNVKGASRRFR